MNGFRPPPQPTNSGARDGDGAEEMIPAYKAWKGSNVFLLQGKFIFGPDARSVLLTLFLIVAPVAVFCAFVARKLMDDFSHHLGIGTMVVVVVFTVYDIILLLMTSGRDPGIVPRNTHPPEPEGYNVSTEIGQTPQLRLPRFKDVVVNGVVVKIKYCDTCMLYRPPRCSHCSICNNCVQNFDHHCPWVGQCIGKRNYRFFFMFVSSTTLLCLYVFAFCWVCIIKIKNSEHISIWKAMSKTPASIALIAYTFVAVWFVGGLTVFHLYLIGTNQSTYENFRYRYDRRANPYNRGVIKNFSEVFFTSIPKSKNNFRAMVPKEPEIHPRMVGSAFVSRSMAKSAAEMEMRSKPAYDDTSANEEDFSNDESVDFTPPQPDLNTHHRNENLGTRGAFYSRQTSLGRRSGNWNLSPEVVSMASQIGDSNRIVRVDSSNRR